MKKDTKTNCKILHLFLVHFPYTTAKWRRLNLFFLFQPSASERRRIWLTSVSEFGELPLAYRIGAQQHRQTAVVRATTQTPSLLLFTRGRNVHTLQIYVRVLTPENNLNWPQFYGARFLLLHVSMISNYCPLDWRVVLQSSRTYCPLRRHSCCDCLNRDKYKLPWPSWYTFNS